MQEVEFASIRKNTFMADVIFWAAIFDKFFFIVILLFDRLSLILIEYNERFISKINDFA